MQAGASPKRGASRRERIGTSSMAAERVATPMVTSTRMMKSGIPVRPMRSPVIQRKIGQW